MPPAAPDALDLLQPEDLDSSRLYVCLLLSSGPGQPLPTPATAAGQIALQQQILAEDIRSQAALDLAGLPLDRRDEAETAWRQAIAINELRMAREGGDRSGSAETRASRTRSRILRLHFLPTFV